MNSIFFKELGILNRTEQDFIREKSAHIPLISCPETLRIINYSIRKMLMLHTIKTEASEMAPYT